MNVIQSGTVVKMLPTERSHEKEPYYAMVTFYDSNAVMEGQVRCITTIPSKRQLIMYIGNNWEYHSRRMEIVGTVEKYGHLLYNQSFQYTK